jgi:hypothetical protein
MEDEREKIYAPTFSRDEIIEYEAAMSLEEDERENKYALAYFEEDEIEEYETTMSLERLQYKPQKIKHLENVSVVFPHKDGEVNEVAMSDQALCPAQ